MVISESRWSNTAYAIFFAGVVLHFTFMAIVIPGSGRPEAWLPLVGAYLIGVPLMRMFMVLRVRVDGTDLKVGFGPFRKRIPLHDIQQVAPGQYRPSVLTGWGIRVQRGGVLFNVPGDQGRVVDLTLRNGRRVRFSAEDPEAVCTAIRAQCAAMP